MADIVRFQRKGRGVIPLFHSACGALVSRINNCDMAEAYATLQRVTRHLCRQGDRCPQCKMMLTEPGDILPSLEAFFVPVATEDESGLVGFHQAAGSN